MHHLDGRVTIYRFAYYRKISAVTKEYAGASRDQSHRPGEYEVVQAHKTLDKRPKRHPSV
jgi:hypothetical protein